MNRSQIFPSKWLTAADLPSEGLVPDDGPAY